MGKSKKILLCIILFQLIGCSSIINLSRDGTEEEVYAQRSIGTALDDSAIVGKIESKLRNLNEHYASMIQVDAYNKIVLLTGRVPDKNFIEEALETASLIPGVRQVHSEISVGKPTTISHYWYDAWLTTKVKSQFTWTNNVPGGKTKVRSFAGKVYVMGVMTPKEAKRTLYVASRVPGAKKVVSLIETIELDNNKPLVSKSTNIQQKSQTKKPQAPLETQAPVTIQPLPEFNASPESEASEQQFEPAPSSNDQRAPFDQSYQPYDQIEPIPVQEGSP